MAERGRGGKTPRLVSHADLSAVVARAQHGEIERMSLDEIASFSIFFFRSAAATRDQTPFR
jgi:hypothetical protein